MNWIITLCLICASINLSAYAFRNDQAMRKPHLAPNKPVRKAAGFVIYRRNRRNVNEYLLMKASSENHHWTPPKGHLEKNESDIEAAIRETEEEAGIQVSDINIHHDFEKILRYEPKDKHFIKQVTYWLAHLTNPDKPINISHEHLEYKWLALKQAKDCASYPEMQELFDECENYLSKVLK